MKYLKQFIDAQINKIQYVGHLVYKETFKNYWNINKWKWKFQKKRIDLHNDTKNMLESKI